MPARYQSLTTFIRERPFHYLWGLAADLAIFVYTIILGPAAALGVLTLRRGWPADVIGRVWCRLIIWTCGIDVELEGAENLRPGRSYVLISNHLSNFDIWATLATLPRTLRFVAKKELVRIPFFGWALAASDHIVINRQNPAEAIETINAAMAGSLQGVCILFYAEGTRSPDGKIHDFKKGGVVLALRGGLPVAPVSVSGTANFLPKGCSVIRPSGRVRIVIDQPIETKHLTLDDRDQLNQRVRERVVANFVEDY
jgi:1-acyl-sn-glycerol-3-phosphate acyltransferase